MIPANTLRVGARFYILDKMDDNNIRMTFYKKDKPRPFPESITRWWAEDPKYKSWCENHAIAVIYYGMVQNHTSTCTTQGHQYWIDGRIKVCRITWLDRLKAKRR